MMMNVYDVLVRKNAFGIRIISKNELFVIKKRDRGLPSIKHVWNESVFIYKFTCKIFLRAEWIMV